jgi:hypothetical protein
MRLTLLVSSLGLCLSFMVSACEDTGGGNNGCYDVCAEQEDCQKERITLHQCHSICDQVLAQNLCNDEFLAVQACQARVGFDCSAGVSVLKDFSACESETSAYDDCMNAAVQ